jgi:DNA-binding transcriptional MocR family regulator
MTTSERFSIADLFTESAKEAPQPMFGAAQQGHVPLISLAFGLADPALFPRAELAAAAAAVLADDAAAALNYGPTYPGLIEQIVTRLRQEGVEAEPENIIAGYGSSQILGLLPQVFVEPGDVVLIEGPSFMGAVRRFQDARANLVTIPVDEHGMNVDALEETLRNFAAQGVRPKFIYTIPTFHNPSGVTMPLERRQKLVALGAEYGVVIVEDDAYGDLRFEGDPLPNLAALDSEGWVMRVSTYSKTLAPGVRTGWAYANPEIIARLQKFKIEGGNSPFLTRVIARYSADGRYERHIEELVKLYRSKRDRMVAAIEREFPAGYTLVLPEGGFFIWLTLPEGVSATALLEHSKTKGAAFLPGTHCYANGQGDNEIRLSFSFQPADQLETGIARIGAAMHEILA